MNNVVKLITGIMVCLCMCLLACPVMGIASDNYGHGAIPIENDLRNIDSTGTQLSLGDDSTAADIPIGFDFNFYGNDRGLCSK